MKTKPKKSKAKRIKRSRVDAARSDFVRETRRMLLEMRHASAEWREEVGLWRKDMDKWREMLHQMSYEITAANRIANQFSKCRTCGDNLELVRHGIIKDTENIEGKSQ